MENNTTEQIPILKVAWSRYAQLDAASERQERPHYGIRRWIAVLGVLATIFAVLTETYPDNFLAMGKILLKVLLIASPITASLLALIYNKFHGGGGFLVLRAGAEEIQKEIYMFRTVLKDKPQKRAWLEKRLAEIQRQVYRGLGGEMILEQYKGSIPPYYYPDNPDSDAGFAPLNGDEYFVFRLQDQLAWHIRKNNKIHKERVRLQWSIGIAGALGAAFAAFDFYLWVTISAAFAAAFIGWQELRNLDNTLKNYSKVILELTLIYDHWTNLEPEERTEVEFHKMVKGTEDVLWGQNQEYIRSMQDALRGAELEEADLLDDVLKEAVASDARLKKQMRDSVVDFTTKKLRKGEEIVADTFENALGTIAEEASSDLVQQELAAMGAAVEDAVENIVSRFSKLRSTMDEIATDYEGVEFSAETPASELHTMMQRFPKTGEVKG
ncbi:MAG: SLATT domain-containing protein [Anaerolineae bacterium]|nr:SLATT domain-containing protein [Anaerolineae bacterium]MBT7783861.1 SLATT domain-containing protein [Anaerolineae bacterium]